ncbi:hypothetical protein BKE30_14365 [Alkanindiges hydrocarboniclasticus]|uniref:TraB/GumN family protein n=2 Tax=Alkanindiges hydrocarboniclasticus TaxID=1907941 RepID=A0A1S8CQM8_9GAMM|nr:hypothetical protein BKE30_14365 [Alkanindiges hydrocarboniclasticus]
MDGQMPIKKYTLKNRLTTILWFIACIGFLLSLPIILGASGWLLFGLIILSLLLALLATGIARYFFKKPARYRFQWITWSLALLFLLSFVVAAPVYYLAGVTQMHPALVPQVTLTNGDKTIVFQGMQHVGIERFYKSVVYDLEDALSKGYVLYYEGVRPSTPEADTWLNRTVTGGTDLTTTYRLLGDVCGLQFQNDYFGLLAQDVRQHPQSHVVADVSTLELKNEYDRLMSTDVEFAQAMRQQEQEAVTSPPEVSHFITFLKKGSVRQRELAGIVCRGVMTMTLRHADEAQSDSQLDKVILDFRNGKLAEQLLAEPRDKIYITYGAKHLPGVFKLLHTADPRWHSVSIKWMRTVDEPENYMDKSPI